MSSLRARISSTAETRKVTSSVHQGRDCQPCILCKKGNQSKYFHPKSWKDDTLLQSLRDHEPSLNIQPESCICRPCRNDVSHISEDGFIPRWRKQTPQLQECWIPDYKLVYQNDPTQHSLLLVVQVNTHQPTNDAGE